MQEEIIKIHLLSVDKTDGRFKTKKTFVFNDFKNETPQIHNDDSIHIIKNKILNQINTHSTNANDKISYKELYIFSNSYSISPIDAYKSITKNDTEILTRSKFRQFLKNANISKELSILNDKETYTYNDYITIIPEKEPITLSVPFGMKFEKENDLLFSGNPFQFLEQPSLINNSILSLENSLLLNYIHHTPIEELFVCSAMDIYRFAFDNFKNKTEYFSQIYFPFLYQDNIRNILTLKQKRPYLYEETKNNLTDITLKMYKTVDMFYDIQREPNPKIKYLKKGITEFQVIIFTNLSKVSPLDTIFKNLHATQNIPFIKYNPGFRRENIYRLYCDKIDKTGKKIPVLKTTSIIKYSKQLGKNEQITGIIVSTDNIEIIFNFIKNGNLELNFVLETPITIEQIENIFIETINPLLEFFNELLYETGISIPVYTSLNDPHLQITKLKYLYSTATNSKINFEKYRNCFSSIFDIQTKPKEEEIKMIFKRVENYTVMDELTQFIYDIYSVNHNLEIITLNLMENFQITEHEATQEVNNFIDKYVSSQDELTVNGGFPFYLKIFSSQFNIQITDIFSISYIPILEMYMDTIYYILHDDLYTNKTIKKMNNFCKNKINYTNIAVPFENLILNQPIQSNSTETEEEPEAETEAETEAEAEEEAEAKTEAETEEEPEAETEEEPEAEASQFHFLQNQKLPQKTQPKINIMNDDEEEEDDEETNHGGAGGAGANYDYTKIAIKNPNPFQKRIEDRDPELILKQNQANYNGYSRTCPSTNLRQPVILNQEEKDNIDKNHPNSYIEPIQYGSKIPYWYICPQYWSFKDNSSLTQQEVDEILKTNPNAIINPNATIPPNTKTIPKNSFIFAFDKQTEHRDKNGNYIQHYPGLIEDKHPQGLKIPCCFKRKQNENIIKPDKKEKLNYYIMSSNSFPITNERWGFLPLEIQHFFEIDSSKVISKENTAIIKPNTPCFLRYGVVQHEKHSFLSCMVDIYGFQHNIVVAPSVDEFRKIIVNALSLDMFIQYHNGALVSIFSAPPKKFNINKYKNQKFVKTILENTNSKTKLIELKLLKETVGSFENFLNYLQDENAFIDHTYLWDIFTQPNPNIFPEGLNLAILYLSTTLPNVVNMVCPTSAYQNTFEPEKPTLILYKQGDFYEPIYTFEMQETVYEMKLFYADTTINGLYGEYMKIPKILEKIQKSYTKCKPLTNLPKPYTRSMNGIEMLYVLQKKYNIVCQVMNYQPKTVGFIITPKDDITRKIYIPCSPSGALNNLPIEFISNINIWKDYNSTVNDLNEIFIETNLPIMPKNVIQDEEQIVGILTKLDQYIRISPSFNNQNKDINLPVISGTDYISVETQIMTNTTPDPERIHIVRNIRIDSRFYRVFRSIIRTLLSQYENRFIKQQIKSILNYTKFEGKPKYLQNLKKIEELIKEIVQDAIIFRNMTEPEIDNLYDDTKFRHHTICKKCQNRDCSQDNTQKCQLIVPKYHLGSGIENAQLYYERIADELLRFKRIQLYILEPQYYLNLVNIYYKINKDEILLLESTINSTYMNDLGIYNYNDYIKNIVYDNAEPLKKEYSYMNILRTVENQGSPDL